VNQDHVLPQHFFQFPSWINSSFNEACH
jgi:hypothetical protein